jgi:phage FluMu gp28-like protein
MSHGPLNLLCPYQVAWLRDPAPLAIGEKSRRIGWTWTQALGAVLDRVSGRGHYYHSSADMTASVEFIRECEQWAQMVNAVARVTEESQVIDDDEIHTLVMTFANGLKIVAGSSNPKFFRSKGGAVGFDEYDFHRDQRALFQAGHATAMFWGYPMRIWSSVNGQGTYMDRLVQSASRGQIKASVHRVTVLDAVEQGIVERIDMRRRKLDHVPAPDAMRRREWLEELRSTCPDEDTWRQEYLCVRSTDAASLLNYDLIAACEVANLSLSEVTGPLRGSMYAGFDVGRKHDLSVLWVVEQVGDVYWTRILRSFDRVNFSAQEGALNQLLSGPAVRRLCIDATGLGMQMSERLQERWGKYRVEAVNFTAAVKSELAMPLRRLFEDKLIRVPMDDAVREDLHSVRKVMTAAGNVRFDADHGPDGHADRFWALALACHAAHQPVSAGVIAL